MLYIFIKIDILVGIIGIIYKFRKINDQDFFMSLIFPYIKYLFFMIYILFNLRLSEVEFYFILSSRGCIYQNVVLFSFLALTNIWPRKYILF